MLTKFTAALLAVTATVCGCQEEDDRHYVDIWDWMYHNFANHQSEEVEQELFSYFESIRDEVSDIIAYDVPAELLAEQTGEPVENITLEWRDGAHDHIYAHLEYFDLQKLMDQFTKMQVNHLKGHFHMSHAQ